MGADPWGGFHSIKHKVPGGLAELGPSGRSQNIVFYGMDCKVGQFHSIKHKVAGAFGSQMAPRWLPDDSQMTVRLAKVKRKAGPS